MTLISEASRGLTGPWSRDETLLGLTDQVGISDSCRSQIQSQSSGNAGKCAQKFKGQWTHSDQRAPGSFKEEVALEIGMEGQVESDRGDWCQVLSWNVGGPTSLRWPLF